MSIESFDWDRYVPLTQSGAVQAVKALAARGWSDPEIARELGLQPKQVNRIRRVHGIEAGVPGGGQPSEPLEVPLSDRPLSLADGSSANGRWVALIERADPGERLAMRRVVCRVLGLDVGVADQSMIVAAQRDRRTAEELANAYLLKLAAEGAK